jgi:molecular chaperone DnaK
MLREAEEHSAEDRRRREEIDARNELDSLAYRAEQLLRDLQDRLPVNEKARAEDLIQRARDAVQNEAGLDQVRPLISDLQQALQSLPSAAQQAAPSGAPTSNGAGDGDGAATADDEEVVDAEFTRE